jgi:hypothetical protein
MLHASAERTFVRSEVQWIAQCTSGLFTAGRALENTEKTGIVELDTPYSTFLPHNSTYKLNLHDS